jgi:hypothetical protein
MISADVEQLDDLSYEEGEICYGDLLIIPQAHMEVPGEKKLVDGYDISALPHPTDQWILELVKDKQEQYTIIELTKPKFSDALATAENREAYTKVKVSKGLMTEPQARGWCQTIEEYFKDPDNHKITKQKIYFPHELENKWCGKESNIIKTSCTPYEASWTLSKMDLSTDLMATSWRVAKKKAARAINSWDNNVDDEMVAVMNGMFKAKASMNTES